MKSEASADSKAPDSGSEQRPRRALYGGPSPYADAVARPAAPGEIDLARLLHVLRKKKVTVAAAVLFAVLAAGFYVLVAKRTFRAVSLVELSVRRPRIASQQGALLDDAYSDVQSEEIFNTWLERFKSRTLLDSAVAQFRESADVAQWADEKLRKTLVSCVNIVLIRRSQLVRITFDYSTPSLAAAGANAFADAAAQLAFEENKAAADNAVAWLQAQAGVGRRELERADQELLKFRAENKMDALESWKKNAEEALVAFNRALIDIEGQEVLARDLYNTLESIKLEPESAGKLPGSIPRAPEIQAMLEKWLAAVSERDALLTKYTAKHPEVLAKGKEIEVLRGQCMEAITRARQTATSNLELLEKQGKSLREKIKEASQRAADLELQLVDLNARLNALERTREAADISYKGILNRIEEARLSADENTATVKIVEKAIPPEKPIRPRKSVVLLISLLLGVVGGVGLALLTDRLEDYVVAAGDIETGVGVGILALVPHLARVRREDLATACLTDKFSQFAEAFAGIRAALDSSRFKDISHTVLIASTAPGEGKTITASNLAIMCAKSGLRTLLIDFDMRRPHVDRVFKVPTDAESLVHILSRGDLSVFNLLPFKSSCEHLDIVTSRVDEDLSPAEIMGSGVVRQFIAWASQKYDRVIVDSPPVSVVSDAVVLADLVPCVLLVCRQNHSRKRAMRSAVDRLREAGANIIGAVVNDVQFRQGFFPGDFEGYYGHYNYHKYFADRQKKEGPAQYQ